MQNESDSDDSDLEGEELKIYDLRKKLIFILDWKSYQD